MKIIFCDVDGVLNNLTQQMISDSGLSLNPLDNFYSESVSLLNRLCRETGALVVISSSWRKIIRLRTQWNDIFQLWCKKLDEECFIKVYDLTGSSDNGFRGREINNFISIHTQFKSIERYVIIDDESDFYPNQPRVKCSPYKGFDNARYMEALGILNGEIDGTGKSCLQERKPPSN